MHWERRSLQIGAAALLCAVALRLVASGALGAVIDLFSDPKVAAVLFYLETGRPVRPGQAPQSTQPAETQPPRTEPVQPPTTVPEETEQPEEEPPALPVFSPRDSALVEINSVCGYETDLSGWLQKPLSWDLAQEQPTVLILHTHGTEAYTKTEDYQESSKYRTLNKDYNVVFIGKALKEALEAEGIGVIHDTTMHDQPSFSGAYGAARKTIKQYLKEYPSIALVLDIHRDSVEDSKGKQVRFTAKVDGQTTGRLMLVVGTDANGLKHPDWPDNMALAVKLHAQLEKNAPGICRPISFRKQRFNQDLSAGGLIVEVGSAGNTRQEALLAAKELAKAVVQLAKGTAVE